MNAKDLIAQYRANADPADKGDLHLLMEDLAGALRPGDVGYDVVQRMHHDLAQLASANLPDYLDQGAQSAWFDHAAWVIAMIEQYNAG